MERDAPLLLSGKVQKKDVYHTLTVRLSDELKDAIVLQSLTDSIEGFKKDLKGKTRIFDYDSAKDKKIIKDYIAAMEMIAQLYK